MNKDYQWIKFYEALADKLLEYKDNRKELHTIMSELSQDYPLLNYLHFERDDWWETKNYEIDPFTIMGAFNRGITDKNRISIANIYAKTFSIKVPVPNDFGGIPVLFNMSSIFGDNGSILWDLFIEAMKYSKTEEATEDFKEAFEKAIAAPWNGLGTITMGLYWIRPNFFINLDSTNSSYIPHNFNIEVPDKTVTGDGYLQFLNEIKVKAPDLTFTEISHLAWEDTLRIRDGNKYSPGLTVEDWQELLKDDEVFKTESLEIMKRIKDYGGKATCTQLSNKYGEAINFYNKGASALAQRVHRVSQCKTYEENGNKRWWRILFTGSKADKQDEGFFYWKLRDELNIALDGIDLSKINLYASDFFAVEDKPNQIIIKSIEKYDKTEFLDEVYLSEDEYDTLAALLTNKKNIILQGAPGVGKTFAAKRLAWSMIGVKDESRIEMIQFHQNYSYEDFIMGYKPKEDGFQLQDGIFVNFCRKAAKDSDQNYFLIIDEINRGNMSKVFGELLMLIENDYRGKEIRLPYSGEVFSVPENLYIIGMMNTADRSLAMIDYALRRRFSFYEMEPSFDSEGFKSYQENLNNERFNKLIEFTKSLNLEIEADPTLGKGFCIGHSYFTGQKECTNNWMNLVVKYDILPMLKEYWFDEDEKVNNWASNLKGILDAKI